MSTFSRPKTSRQLRHPGARSQSHKSEKAAAEQWEEITTISVPAPKSNTTSRPFEALGLTSHEFVFDDGKWYSCAAPEEFSNHLEQTASERNWFYQSTHRRGKPALMRRKTKNPLEVLTVTFAPWLSEWALSRLLSGQPPVAELARIEDEFSTRVLRLLSNNRHVIGRALHADTDDLHLDFVVTRQDGEGRRIGAAGLHLVGPWTTAVDRQLRSGAVIADDKRRTFGRNVAKFKGRYGDKVMPLDVALARALDEAADSVIGPELRPFREAYAKSVPALEAEHRRVALAALESAKNQILGRDLPPEERTI
jgi:hypothetical protein